MKTLLFSFLLSTLAFASESELTTPRIRPFSEEIVTDEDLIQEIDMQTYEKVLMSHHFVILDVYANWCGPCKRLKPVLQELARETQETLVFVKCNAEKEPFFSYQLKITALPTLIFYKDAKEVGRHLGYLSKEQLLAKIEQYLIP